MANFSTLRKLLRRLGNPYASLEVETQKCDAMSASEIDYSERRDQYSDSQNPYALHFYIDAPEAELVQSPVASVAAVKGSDEGLSQALFEQRARAIFRPYIPAEEKGKLRAHHREFIARNKARSPRVRFLLIERLSKYDISNISGLNPQFNRERDALVIEKLAEIEKLFADIK